MPAHYRQAPPIAESTDNVNLRLHGREPILRTINAWLLSRMLLEKDDLEYNKKTVHERNDSLGLQRTE